MATPLVLVRTTQSSPLPGGGGFSSGSWDDPTIPATSSLTIPAGLKLAIALLVVGGAVEVLNTFSPTTAYALVALVLLGYAAVKVTDKKTRSETFNEFLTTIGVLTS